MTIDYKIFDRDKFTVVGTPTITDDGVTSGFSSSNYLKNTSLFSTPKDKIKISTKFIVSDVTNEATVYSYGNGDIRLTVRNNYIQWLLRGSAGTLYPIKYVIINNGDRVKVETVITEGRLEASISVNGIDIELYTYNSNNLSLNNFQNQGLYIGVSQILTGVFFGSIDLKEFLITVDGVEVLSGSHKGTLTDKLIYLNDTKQIIKQAIMDKGVEITPDTPFREYADKIGEISGGDDPEVLAKLDTINGEVI